MKLFVVAIAVLAMLSPSAFGGRLRRGTTEEAETAYIKQVANNLNSLCEGADGNGVPPEYCTCDNAPGMTTKGPYDLNDVFNLIFDLFGCGPGDCKCPGVEDLVDSRPNQLKTVLASCPKGEDGVSTIEKGKCQNGREIDYPFDIKNLFFGCQPKALKCKGSDYLPFTGFGCAAGGFPGCPDKNWSKTRQMKCSDGAIVDFADAIKARLGDGCICSDGKAPRCVENPDQYPTCPDGSQIDLSVGTPGHLWDACEIDSS